ncbi:unnamed protein product [Ilex paraguariensis]|uniref:Uncharacterized protein n=1 Tax=Ilex paraguariensis TaxID=185542 RepID=A0ABC8T997_9AQUA
MLLVMFKTSHFYSCLYYDLRNFIFYCCFSDELLLQEDGSDVSCMANEFSNGMLLGQNLVPSEPFVGARRFNCISNTSSNILVQRPNGPVQPSSCGEVGGPPLALGLLGGYGQPMTKPSNFMPQFVQNSPSRFGQQPVQRFNHGRSTAVRGSEWNHVKVQASLSSFNSGGPRSPGSHSTSWGRRGNHPVSNIPPTSRGRKDYGRIA